MTGKGGGLEEKNEKRAVHYHCYCYGAVLPGKGRGSGRNVCWLSGCHLDTELGFQYVHAKIDCEEQKEALQKDLLKNRA